MTEQRASIRLSTEHKGRRRRDPAWIGRYRIAGKGGDAAVFAQIPDPLSLSQFHDYPLGSRNATNIPAGGFLFIGPDERFLPDCLTSAAGADSAALTVSRAPRA